MKFIVSSSELSKVLQSVSRVIPNKIALPILDNFLFTLKGNTLEITASDLEMTLITSIQIDDVREDGRIAVPAKILTDSIREFSDIPLEFSTLDSENTLKISWISGESKIPYFSADEYPSLPELDNVFTCETTIPSDILLRGINNTLYATAEEELRPIMNGIYFDMTTDSTSFVATDSHKLVCYTRKDLKNANNCSFTLAKKPANILKSILQKSESDVSIIFDTKNAKFRFDNNILVCRLIEGNYPAYRSVIPANNPNKLYADRIELLNVIKRVSVCSNPATAHVKFSLSQDRLIISAEDNSSSTSSHESVNCKYEGDTMEIGFRAPFLADILNTLSCEEVTFELMDPTRAALILPSGENDPSEEIISLIMPIRIP